MSDDDGRVIRRKGKGWKIGGAWSTLTSEHEQALPPGSRLFVMLDGVSVSVVKQRDGEYAIESRGSVPARSMVGKQAAPRVLRGVDGDGTAG